MAIVQGVKENGKDDLKIVPYSVDKKKALEEVGVKVKEIPCGKCIGCRLDHSRMWANRMMMELQYHDSAVFVTLTYSDDFLPRHNFLEKPTLRKDHLQKFMKHVRKHFGEVRFFGCGEYGPLHERPHYHLIIFGLSLDDMKPFKRNEQGDWIYTSESLEKCWSNYIGKDKNGNSLYDKIGFVSVSDVTWNTCAYVARYVTKKLKGPLSEYYKINNLEPPFALMSRNPGIGKNWYIDHPGWEQYDFINVKSSKGAKKFRPPRYFDRLLEKEDPSFYEVRKEERQAFFDASRMALEATIDKPYLEYLADQEYILKNKAKSLDRKEC